MSDEARETTLVGTSAMAVVLAAVYWVSRVGFDNPIPPVINALGLSLFLVSAPLFVTRLVRRSLPHAWWTSQSVVTVLCIMVTILAGLIAGRTRVSPALLFVSAGFILSSWTFVRWALTPGERGRASMALIAGATVFTVWCAGVVWGSRYKMPLFWETLSFKANIHHDTFYYASIANMIETYGVPSTGLDGIPLIHYHFGSPWLFAKWADLLGTDVLSFYSLGYPVIVLPLFFSSLLLFSAEIRAALATDTVSALRSDWRAWLVFLAATAGFIPTSALDALAVWNSNTFVSESYLIGMAVFFLTLGAGLAFGMRHKTESQHPNWNGAGFLIVFVPAMLAALGFLKVSLMLLAFVLAVYLAVRLKWHRRPMVVLSVLVSAGVVFFTYRVVSLPAHNTGVWPLHFMRHHAAPGWQQFFPLFHFLWSWVYLAARAWEEGARDFRTLGSALRNGRLIDAEALAVVAIAGFIPGELIAIHGGSAIYFSDVQRWLALSLILARIGMWRRPSAARAETVRGAAGIRLSTVLLVFVAAPFVATLIVNLAQWPARVLRANITVRRDLAAQPAAYKPIVMALREISRLPKEQRRRSLLFIPHSSTQYWSMFAADDRCGFTPLVAPAIASVALLDGMPGPTCEVTDQYNMSIYEKRTRPQTNFDRSDRQVCAKARSRGFDRVIVLEAADAQVPRRRRIDCYLE